MASWPIIRRVTNDGPGAAPQSISPRPLRRGNGPLRIALAILLLGVLASPASASLFKSKFPYAAGDTVEIEGTVTDDVGRPIPDLEIVLEMAKLRISLRPPGREKGNISRGATRTDQEGHFAFEWDWRPGFDRFEVIAAVYVAEPEGKRLQVLERIDVTPNVRQGDPINVPVVLEDTSLLDQLNELRRHLDSVDEQRVYEAHGSPDRIDSAEYGGRTESAWWYFNLGKVYRFDNGRLTATETFDPVRPL